MNMYPYGNYGITPVKNEISKVNGIEGAKAFPMTPNSQAMMLDMNEDIFYIKVTDSANYPTIDAYKYEKISTDAPTPKDYVTRAEFEELKALIKKEGVVDEHDS